MEITFRCVRTLLTVVFGCGSQEGPYLERAFGNADTEKQSQELFLWAIYYGTYRCFLIKAQEQNFLSLWILENFSIPLELGDC